MAGATDPSLTATTSVEEVLRLGGREELLPPGGGAVRRALLRASESSADPQLVFEHLLVAF